MILPSVGHRDLSDRQVWRSNDGSVLAGSFFLPTGAERASRRGTPVFPNVPGRQTAAPAPPRCTELAASPDGLHHRRNDGGGDLMARRYEEAKPARFVVESVGGVEQIRVRAPKN